MTYSAKRCKSKFLIMVKHIIYQYEKLIGGGIVTESSIIQGTAQFCYERILFYKKTLEKFKILSIRTIYYKNN